MCNMDYDSVLDEIGQFGTWQKIITALVCIISMVEAFNTFGFTFIGFTPRFRCKIDLCDGDDLIYHGDFLNFSIPPSEVGRSHCLRYTERLSINNSSCVPNAFTESTEICESHVYDSSVYENSYVAEFDLSPCSGADPDWIFGV